MPTLVHLAHDPRCEIRGFDADGRLAFDALVRIGRVSGADVVITALDGEVGVIGGRIGYRIVHEGGQVRLLHGGHITIATVDGVEVDWKRAERVLRPGSVIAFFTNAGAEALRARLE